MDTGLRRRTRLEQIWRVKVDQIVALSMACHEIAPSLSDPVMPALAALAGSSAGRGDPLAHVAGRLLLAHDELAEIEAAMDRIGAGCYGICEQCMVPMPSDWLDETPYIRYCPDCSLERLRWQPSASEAADRVRGKPTSRPPADRLVLLG